VEIRFRTSKLQRQYECSRDAVTAYGPQVGRKYIQRIDIIKQARDIRELQDLPGLNCHPLKGARADEWAISLTGFDRLIFTLEGDRLEVVRIEEVSKHYGD
jgi:proteic killer suppression protein